MGRLVVIAPPPTAIGFALAGADIRAVDDTTADGGQSVEDLVEEAASGDTAVVAVHHLVWAGVRLSTRTRWESRTDRLIVALPADDGAPAVNRRAALHELLARAVGYEIRFTPTPGEPS